MTNPEKLSELAAQVGLTDAELKHGTLPKIVSFFRWVNISVLVMIACMFILEYFLPADAPRAIDSKVIIAVVGGITIQTGAIIVAAFKGLFG